MMNNDKEEQKEESNIYSTFEQEFGRTLSPMEYEVIAGWLDGEFSEETILLALKEAVYNGVSHLRYIDKILYSWKKKGIKTKDDVEKDREGHQKRRTEAKQEVFDYDWLNDQNE
ncbi:DNA replication protein DnaD [compost metagenome]